MNGAPDQVGALCWVPDDAGRRYVLVTSRRLGRWVFPKGGVEGCEERPEAALREAEEEAGVIGTPGSAPVGCYRSLKVSDDSARWLTVELWPVRVDRLADKWEEKGLRNRRVAAFDEALALLGQEDMRELLVRFETEMTGG